MPGISITRVAIGLGTSGGIIVPVVTLSLIPDGVRINWISADITAQTEIWGRSDSGVSALLYTINAGTVTKDDIGVTPVDLRYYKLREFKNGSYSAFSDEVSIAMLGAELINQSSWYTDAYWGIYRDTWTQSGNSLVCVKNGSAYAGKSAIFTIGKVYRIITTVIVNGGANPSYYIYDSINLGERMSVSGTYNNIMTAAGTNLWLLGAYCDITVTALSIKEIL